MTTLTRTFKSVAERESEVRRARWEARGLARGVRLRKRAFQALWLLVGLVSIIAAALFLRSGA